MNQAELISQMMFGEQKRLVDAFSCYDGHGSFHASEWDRAGLGGGRACILEDGRVLERAGINVSLVRGERVPPVIAESRPHTRGMPYTATGISMVLHPRSPYAPSFHANFRFFSVSDDEWWFGGGCDLTPAYGFDDDAAHFHCTLKAWCDRHDPAWYPAWKAACDRYFTITHRGEMRGVGGVFFDYLADHAPGGFARCQQAIADGLATILPAYLPILDRRCAMPYGERERAWQLVRRGRYVEFNLVCDRGTRFGLQTRGNIEAILMSLPPLARWGFDIQPEPGSPEGNLARFLQPQDWAVHHSGPEGPLP
jgi:coproporphyrinogen III oxidase